MLLLLNHLQLYNLIALRYSEIFFELSEGPIQRGEGVFLRCAGHIEKSSHFRN